MIGGFSGLFGAAIQRGLTIILTPVVNSLAFYVKLFEMEVLKRLNFINEATYNDIKRHNALSYLMMRNSGDGLATDKNLLPKPKAQEAKGSGEK